MYMVVLTGPQRIECFSGLQLQAKQAIPNLPEQPSRINPGFIPGIQLFCERFNIERIYKGLPSHLDHTTPIKSPRLTPKGPSDRWPQHPVTPPQSDCHTFTMSLSRPHQVSVTPGGVNPLLTVTQLDRVPTAGLQGTSIVCLIRGNLTYSLQNVTSDPIS